MVKLIMIVFLASSLYQQTPSQPPIVEQNEFSACSTADLSSNEKKEAIRQLLSNENCEWKGIKLYGKIQFVNSFPDIKIKYVKSFPDIEVKFVDSFPDDCGEWQVVSSFPDFKVQIVNSFPDLKVKKVTSFPGMSD